MARQLFAVLSSLVLLTACTAREPAPATSPASSVADRPEVISTAAQAPPPGPHTEKWVDLRVGDCVAEVPRVELGEVTADVVDCSAPHLAEVYSLAPIAVNAAVADVANAACSAQLGPYAGPGAGALAVTYLIDSRQDRTSNNPLPSTVICLLQARDGAALTGSARQ